MKNTFLPFYTVVSVLFVLFQALKYDIALLARRDSFGYQIVLGFIDYFVYIVYVLVVIASVVYAIRGLSEKSWKAYVPALI